MYHFPAMPENCFQNLNPALSFSMLQSIHNQKEIEKHEPFQVVKAAAPHT